MSHEACPHGEWEVSALGSDVPLEWHSDYPPPPTGTRLLLAEGDLPNGVADMGSRWIVVESTWIVAYCSSCERTVATPTLVIAPEDRPSREDVARG